MALLMVVILLMKEAGKPERWMWMGFERSGNGQNEGDISIDLGQSQNINGRAVDGGDDQNTDQSEWTIINSATPSSAGKDEHRPPQSDSNVSPANPDRQFDRQFWSGVYQSLPPENQLALFHLVRKIAQSDLSIPQNSSSLEKLVKDLEKRHSHFQTEVLGEHQLMTDVQKKQEQTAAFFDFDQRWQQDILPTLKQAAVGDDFTFAGQLAVKEVLTTLRPHVLSNVEDLTRIGHRHDAQAWLLIWDQTRERWQNRVSDGDAHPIDSDPDEITFLQLSGQPSAYRGKLINLRGTARTFRKKIPKQTKLAMDHYYEVWIDPTHQDGDGLYCVYAENVPSEFGLTRSSADAQKSDALIDPGKFVNLDVPVTLSGRFFKLRSYQDAGGSVSHCPVIIAQTVKSARPVVASAPLRPNWQLLGWVLGGVALASTYFAVLLFRSSRTSKRSAGRTTTARTEKTLDTLQQDPTVKSNAQRIAELSDEKQ